MHDAERAAAAAAVTVSGRVTLLGVGADASRDVASAIVYLEPIAPARPTTVAVAVPPPATAPPSTVVTAPRDTVATLWQMVRDLRETVVELRDAVRQLRVQLAGSASAPSRDATSDSARAPTTPMTSATPSPTSQAGAAPVGVPTGAPAGSPGASAPVPPRVIAGAVMAMRQKTFEPHVRVVEVGGLVEYPNRDPFSHNVFSTTPGGAFDLGLYSRGESRGVAFRRTGTYAIFCNIHSKMSAYVVAVPTALHAQPAADGRFTIADVPPGRYRLHVWHERAPEQVAALTVGERAASDVQVTLDGRGYHQNAHLNKFGQPYSALTRDAY